MKKYLLSFIFIYSVFLVYSQDIDYFNDFKSSLDKEIQTELNKIENSLKEAEGLHKQAENFLNSKDTSNSLKYYKKAASIFESGYRDIYMSFSEGLNLLSGDLKGQKKDYVEHLVFNADNYFRRSIAERLTADATKDDRKASELYSFAHKNEYDAVHTQCHTFAVITGRINEDMTIQEPDYTNTEVFDNSVTDNFDNRNFTIKGISMPENFNYHTTEISYKDDVVKNDETNTNVKEPNSDNYSKKGTEYRIQIGTSIIPANKSQIDRLNSTDLDVRTYKSQLYYKYTIGSFANFQEAKNFKNAYGLANTYIVEYKNGKEVKLYLRDFQ